MTDKTAKKPKLDLSNADATIDAFGGLRPLATALGVPASTVQGWKERGSIPKGRAKEIQSAFDKADQASDIPVDHAIDAAAEMKDTVPPMADKETRNYQPPRSKEVRGAGASTASGGSNLILSLILLGLLFLLGLLAYSLFSGRDGVKGADLGALAERVGALEAGSTTLNEEVSGLSADVAGVSGKLDDLLGLNDRISTTTDKVEAVSGQLGEMAIDMEKRAEDQANNMSEISRAQTGLFETLSQDLLGKMDTISANMDQSVTDQIERLRAQANAALEEAQNQATLAQENEARALAAEQAMAAGIKDNASIMQLRLALAKHAPFADEFAVLTQLAADKGGVLSVAQKALAPFADGEFGANGIPTELAMLEMVDAMIEADKNAAQAAAGGGFVVVSTDTDTNQGKLRAARAALTASDLDTARSLIEALEGEGSEQAASLIAIIEANQGSMTAEAALDNWIAITAGVQS